jgi:hypothetical protein
MSTFDDIGEAMLLAQEGQAQIAQQAAADFARLIRRIRLFLIEIISKAPPAQV